MSMDSIAPVRHDSPASAMNSIDQSYMPTHRSFAQFKLQKGYPVRSPTMEETFDSAEMSLRSRSISPSLNESYIKKQSDFLQSKYNVPTPSSRRAKSYMNSSIKASTDVGLGLSTGRSATPDFDLLPDEQDRIHMTPQRILGSREREYSISSTSRSPHRHFYRIHAHSDPLANNSSFSDNYTKIGRKTIRRNSFDTSSAPSPSRRYTSPPKSAPLTVPDMTNHLDQLESVAAMNVSTLETSLDRGVLHTPRPIVTHDRKGVLPSTTGKSPEALQCEGLSEPINISEANNPMTEVDKNTSSPEPQMKESAKYLQSKGALSPLAVPLPPTYARMFGRDSAVSNELSEILSTNRHNDQRDSSGSNLSANSKVGTANQSIESLRFRIRAKPRKSSVSSSSSKKGVDKLVKQIHDNQLGQPPTTTTDTVAIVSAAPPDPGTGKRNTSQKAAWNNSTSVEPNLIARSSVKSVVYVPILEVHRSNHLYSLSEAQQKKMFSKVQDSTLPSGISALATVSGNLSDKDTGFPVSLQESDVLEPLHGHVPTKPLRIGNLVDPIYFPKYVVPKQVSVLDEDKQVTSTHAHTQGPELPRLGQIGGNKDSAPQSESMQQQDRGITTSNADTATPFTVEKLDETLLSKARGHSKNDLLQSETMKNTLEFNQSHDASGIAQNTGKTTFLSGPSICEDDSLSESTDSDISNDSLGNAASPGPSFTPISRQLRNIAQAKNDGFAVSHWPPVKSNAGDAVSRQLPFSSSQDTTQILRVSHPVQLRHTFSLCTPKQRAMLYWIRSLGIELNPRKRMPYSIVGLHEDIGPLELLRHKRRLMRLERKHANFPNSVEILTQLQETRVAVSDVVSILQEDWCWHPEWAAPMLMDGILLSQIVTACENRYSSGRSSVMRMHVAIPSSDMSNPENPAHSTRGVTRVISLSPSPSERRASSRGSHRTRVQGRSKFPRPLSVDNHTGTDSSRYNEPNYVTLSLIPATIVPKDGHMPYSAAMKNIELSLSILRERPKMDPRYLWSSTILIDGKDNSIAWGLLEDLCRAYGGFNGRQCPPQPPIPSQVLALLPFDVAEQLVQQYGIRDSSGIASGHSEPLHTSFPEPLDSAQPPIISPDFFSKAHHFRDKSQLIPNMDLMPTTQLSEPPWPHIDSPTKIHHTAPSVGAASLTQISRRPLSGLLNSLRSPAKQPSSVRSNSSTTAYQHAFEIRNVANHGNVTHPVDVTQHEPLSQMMVAKNVPLDIPEEVQVKPDVEKVRAALNRYETRSAELTKSLFHGIDKASELVVPSHTEAFTADVASTRPIERKEHITSAKFPPSHRLELISADKSAPEGASDTALIKEKKEPVPSDKQETDEEKKEVTVREYRSLPLLPNPLPVPRSTVSYLTGWNTLSERSQQVLSSRLLTLYREEFLHDTKSQAIKDTDGYKAPTTSRTWKADPLVFRGQKSFAKTQLIFPPVPTRERTYVHDWLVSLNIGLDISIQDADSSRKTSLAGRGGIAISSSESRSTPHVLDDPLLNGILLVKLARILGPKIPPLCAHEEGDTIVWQYRPYLHPSTFAEVRANLESALQVFRNIPALSKQTNDENSTLRQRTLSLSTLTTEDLNLQEISIPKAYFFISEEAITGNRNAVWGLLLHIKTALDRESKREKAELIKAQAQQDAVNALRGEFQNMAEAHLRSVEEAEERKEWMEDQLFHASLLETTHQLAKSMQRLSKSEEASTVTFDQGVFPQYEETLNKSLRESQSSTKVVPSPSPPDVQTIDPSTIPTASLEMHKRRLGYLSHSLLLGQQLDANTAMEAESKDLLSLSPPKHSLSRTFQESSGTRKCEQSLLDESHSPMRISYNFASQSSVQDMARTQTQQTGASFDSAMGSGAENDVVLLERASPTSTVRFSLEKSPLQNFRAELLDISQRLRQRLSTPSPLRLPLSPLAASESNRTAMQDQSFPADEQIQVPRVYSFASVPSSTVDNTWSETEEKPVLTVENNTSALSASNVSLPVAQPIGESRQTHSPNVVEDLQVSDLAATISASSPRALENMIYWTRGNGVIPTALPYSTEGISVVSLPSSRYVDSRSEQFNVLNLAERQDFMDPLHQTELVRWMESLGLELSPYIEEDRVEESSTLSTDRLSKSSNITINSLIHGFTQGTLIADVIAVMVETAVYAILFEENNSAEKSSSITTRNNLKERLAGLLHPKSSSVFAMHQKSLRSSMVLSQPKLKGIVYTSTSSVIARKNLERCYVALQNLPKFSEEWIGTEENFYNHMAGGTLPYIIRFLLKSKYWLEESSSVAPWASEKKSLLNFSVDSEALGETTKSKSQTANLNKSQSSHPDDRAFALSRSSSLSVPDLKNEKASQFQESRANSGSRDITLGRSRLHNKSLSSSTVFGLTHALSTSFTLNSNAAPLYALDPLPSASVKVRTPEPLHPSNVVLEEEIVKEVYKEFEDVFKVEYPTPPKAPWPSSSLSGDSTLINDIQMGSLIDANSINTMQNMEMTGDGRETINFEARSTDKPISQRKESLSYDHFRFPMVSDLTSRQIAMSTESPQRPLPQMLYTHGFDDFELALPRYDRSPRSLTFSSSMKGGTVATMSQSLLHRCKGTSSPRSQKSPRMSGMKDFPDQVHPLSRSMRSPTRYYETLHKAAAAQNKENVSHPQSNSNIIETLKDNAGSKHTESLQDTTMDPVTVELVKWLRGLGVQLERPQDLAITSLSAPEWSDGTLLAQVAIAVDHQKSFGAHKERLLTTELNPKSHAAKVANIRRVLDVLKQNPQMPTSLLWSELPFTDGSAPVIRRLLIQIKKSYGYF